MSSDPFATKPPLKCAQLLTPQLPLTAEHLRHELEGLFNDYAVDLVFSGHVHSYARTCNVLDERCVDMDDGGTTHITLGCGGHTL